MHPFLALSPSCARSDGLAAVRLEHATQCDIDAIEAKVSGGLLDELIADMAEALQQLRADSSVAPHANGTAGGDRPASPPASLKTPESRRLWRYHQFLLKARGGTGISLARNLEC